MIALRLMTVQWKVARGNDSRMRSKCANPRWLTYPKLSDPVTEISDTEVRHVEHRRAGVLKSDTHGAGAK